MEDDTDLFDIEACQTAVDALDEILLWCVDRKISDIKIQTDEPVWIKKDKIWRRITPRTIRDAEIKLFLTEIYGANAVGEINSGNDLDPSYEVKGHPVGDSGYRPRYRFRVNATGCRGRHDSKGIQITIRTLPSEPPKIEDLGIEPEIIENLRPPEGLNLITGTTGSGKSTLLASCIRYLCEQKSVSVVEFSKPIEFVYDSLKFPGSIVAQSEVGKDLRPRDVTLGGEWEYSVSNAMRRAPDVIVIGEARDHATIRGCIQASMTGHLTFSTMHTIGISETFKRITSMFPESEKVSASSDAIECANILCTQMLLQKIGGGLVACREFIIIDQKVRNRLHGVEIDKWPFELKQMLNSNSSAVGSSMSNSAKKLLQEGLISPDTYEWISSRTSGESRFNRRLNMQQEQ